MPPIIADSDEEDDVYEVRDFTDPQLRDDAPSASASSDRHEAAARDWADESDAIVGLDRETTAECDADVKDPYEVVSPSPPRTMQRSSATPARKLKRKSQASHENRGIPAPPLWGDAASSTVVNSTSTNPETIRSSDMPTSGSMKSTSSRPQPVSSAALRSPSPLVTLSREPTAAAKRSNPVIYIPIAPPSPPPQNTASSKKRKLETRPSTDDHDGDEDELASNLPPPELYKPRPSRSRSFSHSGAAGAETERSNRRLKRSKTTDRSSLVRPAEATDGVDETSHSATLVSMGYSPALVAKAIRAVGNDLNGALDYLMSPQNEQQHSETQQDESEAGVEDADVSLTRQSAHPLTTSRTASPVVEQPPKKRKGRPSASAKKNADSAKLAPKTPAAKRGRGRPKKQVVVAEDEDEVASQIDTKQEQDQDHDKDQAVQAEAIETEQARQPLGDKDTNLHVDPPVQLETIGVKTDEKEAETTTPSKGEVKRALQTPQTVPVGRKMSSLAAIVARSGQTHRVGLSRRLKIEPLLQKVKK